MKVNRKKLVTRLIREDSGQALVLASTVLIVLLAMAGFVLDLGHAMVVNRQLQAGTNAAALAAGQALPASSYSQEGYDYASGPQSKTDPDLNYNASIPGTVNTTVTGYCSSWVNTNLGIGCGSGVGYNAVVVTQSVTIPTYFISILGIDSISLQSTAVAAERGASPIPYNIAIILDTTDSMNDTDSDSQCDSSRETCAAAGLVSMLQNMAPCPTTESSCGTATANSSGDLGYNVTPAEDHIALFQFPNTSAPTPSSSSVFGCAGGTSSNAAYNLTATNLDSYDPTSGNSYILVGYDSNFKTNPQKQTLNSADYIVKALGGYSGCTAMKAKGGYSTYYASALYAAQASLVAEQKANPNTSNVIVMVSDGDASALESKNDFNTSSNSNYNATSGAYPSYVDQCNQAVVAGQAATAAGTKVYAVSYGSESSGCLTGNTAGTAAETAAQTGYTAGITPCETMKNIASGTAYFYSDYTQSGSGEDTSCVGTANSTSNLDDIFTDIAYTLTTARLMNSSASSGCTASAQQTAITNDTANPCP